MRGNKLKPVAAFLTFGVILAVTMVRPVYAQTKSIDIPNASFEVRGTFDPFPDGTDKYNQWELESWRHFECDNNGGPLRIWNPGNPDEPADLTDQGIADVGFGGEAPDGDYVVVVRSRYNDDEFYDPPRPRDFEAAVQLLTETFDPTQSYTLTAEVGRLPGSINYTPSWYGYAVQLAVGGINVDGAKYQGRVEGGTVIAEDYNSLTVPEDTFVTSTVVYTPDPADEDLEGQPLQIRLCVLEDPDDHSLTNWAAFDNVTLSSEPFVADTVNVFTGDANSDGSLNIADAIYILSYLFSGGDQLECMKSGDTNNDGSLNLADVINLLSYLFSEGSLKAPDGTLISSGEAACLPYNKDTLGEVGCISPCSP